MLTLVGLEFQISMSYCSNKLCIMNTSFHQIDKCSQVQCHRSFEWLEKRLKKLFSQRYKYAFKVLLWNRLLCRYDRQKSDSGNANDNA